MKTIVMESFGKINLSLDIVNRREDGYHNIETIMQEIDLKDIVTLTEREKGIVIRSNSKEMPLDENNLVYKAWSQIKKVSNLDKGIDIYIEKNIPMSSGLAGGSSNAAAVLKGLNDLWGLNYTIVELQKIGVKIGADVPFCLLGGTAYARGIGEELEILPDFRDKHILLANNGICISTPYVYNTLDFDENPRKTNIREKTKYIKEDDIYGLAKDLENIMEDVVLKENLDIVDIKNTMIECGALGSLMSGSGPTVFGIFDDEEKLINCKKILNKKIDKVYISKTR